MKKIFFIIFLFTALCYAQNSDQPTRFTSSDQIQNYSFQATLQALRMILVADSSAFQDSILYVSHINSGTAVDTVSRLSNSGDTLNTLAGYFHSGYGYSITTDDTIDVSFNASFPTGKTYMIVPLEAYTPMYKFSISAHPNIYIRRHSVSGATGTPFWRLYLQGK